MHLNFPQTPASESSEYVWQMCRNNNTVLLALYRISIVVQVCYAFLNVRKTERDFFERFAYSNECIIMMQGRANTWAKMIFLN
jgi:hypothetical protein